MIFINLLVGSNSVDEILENNMKEINNQLFGKNKTKNIFIAKPF